MIEIHDAKRLPPGPAGSGVMAAPLDFEKAPRSVGPFAIVVHQSFKDMPPGALPVDADVRCHPHIGLAAISYVVDGAVTHRDSLDNRCELRAGELGVTISGRGVVHSERAQSFEALGGAFELFQLLLALPDGNEDVEPAFFRLASKEIPIAKDGGATTRWLLPRPPDLPPGFPTTTPILLADVSLETGATWSPPDVPEQALLVRSGQLEIDKTRVRAGQIAVVRPDTVIRATEPTSLLAFGGTNVGPRHVWWNYIHSSRERIEVARAEWRAGKVPLPAGDTESFTPSPPDEGRPWRILNERS
jgi:redox-sensitive bicupin YhaK (pirin superfamily)